MRKASLKWRLLALLVVLANIAFGDARCFAEAVEIPLWSGTAPGEPTKPGNEPVMFLYRPAKETATKTAVIVCPGGGYGHLAMDHEGKQIAEWLNSFGVTAFVLRYRHSGTGHKHPTPMLDGQQAIRIVRTRAAEWGIDPTKIGVMGFSAGGHLASTLGTHFDAGNPDTGDPTYHASPRPDFLILCYPVISLTADYTHTGSRDSLLGKQPEPELVRSLSNELQVTSDTPPTFLFHTDEDTAVPPMNSIVFYEALKRAGVPAELHIYRRGGHGLGLARDVPGTNDWSNRCREWLLKQLGGK
jgi:acetyl esterase/lipase